MPVLQSESDTRNRVIGSNYIRFRHFFVVDEPFDPGSRLRIRWVAKAVNLFADAIKCFKALNCWRFSRWHWNNRNRWSGQQWPQAVGCGHLSLSCVPPFWPFGMCGRHWPHTCNGPQMSSLYRTDIRGLQFWSSSPDPNELQVWARDVWSAPDSRLSNQFGRT